MVSDEEPGPLLIVREKICLMYWDASCSTVCTISACSTYRPGSRVQTQQRRHNNDDMAESIIV